jgi:hypothetical protein
MESRDMIKTIALLAALATMNPAFADKITPGPGDTGIVNPTLPPKKVIKKPPPPCKPANGHTACPRQ